MDAELKQVLDAMRHDMGAMRHEMGAMRHEMDVMRQDMSAMRQENSAAHAETRRYVEVAIGDAIEDLRSDLRREIREGDAETRRHSEVIAEGLRHEIQIVAEGVAMNTEQIRQLDQKIDRVWVNLDTRVTRLEAQSSRN